MNFALLLPNLSMNFRKPLFRLSWIDIPESNRIAAFHSRSAPNGPIEKKATRTSTKSRIVIALEEVRKSAG
jgi:hypothetical protein